MRQIQAYTFVTKKKNWSKYTSCLPEDMNLFYYAIMHFTAYLQSPLKIFLSSEN